MPAALGWTDPNEAVDKLTHARLGPFERPFRIVRVVEDWPLAWHVGHQYIEKFTLRSEITIWPFVLSLVITVGIAWASVAFQAMHAATVKPADVLYAE